MEEKKYKLTQEGVEALEQELDHLTVVKRQEIADKLQEARAQGDLSENAEYDAAKDEQRDIEARIEEIEKILKNVEVIDGLKLKILDVELDEEQVINIVGSAEADVLNNKISNESPLGMALIGKKKGEVVEVAAPNGSFQYKILEVVKSKKSRKKKEDK
ncbi:MAG: transcription elongation factor GreA [Lachnospiraceae bacterium]|nr:transcription elongation factor GreA [Lachnospiraceae bacterium]